MTNFIGIKFPYQKSATELPVSSADSVSIQESLTQLILTPRGLRVMRPRLGTNAAMYLFENNTTVLAENIRTDIANTVAQYEPRVILKRIEVSRDAENGSVVITVYYLVKQTLQESQVTVRV